MRNLFWGLLLASLPVITFAQDRPSGAPGYPQHYFRNPLNISIFLAGNFGECRPGHFHSGTDIKTNGVENQPVHAAADGYISRIHMSKSGFGHALYITHPNGYTTLYAHLNHFVPAIQQYMKQEQYRQRHWDIDTQVPPGKFPVKKGQLIAYSGNTGSSTAPHLHFEIRDTKTEHPLNPELFGLPVKDSEPPLPTELALYDMNKSIYMQDPQILSLHKRGSEYVPVHDTLHINTSLAGIGLNVYDYMNGSHNTIAFYSAKVYMDGALQFEVALDNIGYDETRYVNAYADYKTKVQKDKWVQCFFQLPNNRLNSIYRHLNDKRGALAITDGQPHKVRIIMTDDKNNITNVGFYIQGTTNTEKITPEGQIFYAGKPNNFNTSDVSFSLGDKVLYDDIDFRFGQTPDANAFSDKYKVGDPYIPVHQSFELNIKPNKPIPYNLKNKIALIYSDGKDEDGTAAIATDSGWYKTFVRDFGTYWLVADTVPPVIRSLQKNGSNLSHAKQITFEVKDKLTSVDSFEGILDGKWIAFEQHRNLFFYKFDEHCPKGKHTLVFTATDENHNKQTIHFTFTR